MRPLLALSSLAAWLAQTTDATKTTRKPFDMLEHLGANSPWFAGPAPNVAVSGSLSRDAPTGCAVDQAVYVARHGSRYPDPGAYDGWVALHDKIQAAKFTAHGPLAFLNTWAPVLENPAAQLAQVSPGGYDELHTFGVELRTRYPSSWYRYGSPLRVFANDYQRTVDSARLFARGYLGPNATALGTVLAILAKDPSVVGNSLATSDSCPTFRDASGAGYVDVWNDVYLPPIAARLNVLIHNYNYGDGDGLVLTPADVSNFPYLCGFETQIAARRDRSPFCGLFTEEETRQYEYAQDLRYYYGTGPGAARNASVMLPVLQGVVDLLRSGPETPVVQGAADGDEGNSVDVVGPLTVAFTHDNQINELASILGVFDEQVPLAADSLDESRIYVSSRINPMRGTVAFERLDCSGRKYLRLLLNDAVYPVPSCKSGPGVSCPLREYDERVLARKWAEAGGSFETLCQLPQGSALTSSRTGGVTFFTDLTLKGIRVVRP